MSQHATEGPALLRIPEVAAHLRVSRATVYRLIDNKHLATVRVGEGMKVKGQDKPSPGSLRVPRAEIDAYIARMSKKGKASA